MKTAIWLAIAAMLLMPAAASGLKEDSLDIAIAVNADGTAKFTEKYALSFSTPFELDAFRAQAKKNSSSLSAWEADYNFFYPHFQPASNPIAKSEITFNDQSSELTLSYILENSFARLVKDDQRSTLFIIDDKQLQSFIDGGAIVIPENTQIGIMLPQSAEIDSASAIANAVVSQNEVKLKSIQTNSFSLQYRIIKPLGIKGNSLLDDLSNAYFIIVPLLAIVCALLYWRKDEIEKKIEGYLVAHSEINAKEAEEEIDFETE